MKRSYALVVSYSDDSAVLRAFGPYTTEEEARAAEPKLRELSEPEGYGKWDVVPLFTVTIEG